MVLIPRRWNQVGGNDLPPMTVTRTPDRRGEHGNKPLKPIARGMPGDTGVTVVTCSCAHFPLHARLRALTERPAFPAPSVCEGHGFARPGRFARRGNVTTCLTPSLRKRSNPRPQGSKTDRFVAFAPREDWSLKVDATEMAKAQCWFNSLPRQPGGNEFCLRSANHKPSAPLPRFWAHLE